MTATTDPAGTGEQRSEITRGTVLEGIRHKVFLDRYALKGEDGTPREEYPEQMWRRVAAGIAAVERSPEKITEWTEKFYGLLSDFKFVPGGRILSGAGTGHQVTYYNCFSADTLVHTREGIMRIGALSGVHDVLCQDGVFRPATFKSYGVQDLWEVVLGNGTVLRATAGHEWVVKEPHGRRARVTTRALAGRSIPVNPRPKPEMNEDFREGVRHGIIFGDGTTQYGQAHVDLFDEKMGLATRFEDHYPTHAVGATAALAEHVRVANLPVGYKALPRADASPSYWRGFVAGLIATDGHVDNRGSVAIYNSNADQLYAISYGMAQAGFVPSSIKMTREFSPYSGERKPVYRLAIYRSSIAAEDLIKESHALNWAGAPFPKPALIKVESVRPLGYAEDVFCCEEPVTHTLTVGHGYATGNCYVVGLGEDPLDPAAPQRPQLDPAAARPAFFAALAGMTDIMSRSGGVGMNLSALPPRSTPIDAAGRGRSGAVRPTVALSLGHPDVGRLLDEKDGPNLAHVDVAVVVPPAFDAALAGDSEWTPRWGEMAGATIKARDLWARVTAHEGRRVGILRPEAPMLAIEDSRDAIVAGAAQVAQRLYEGTATVIDFSLLRPTGAYIKTVNGTSSGPVAWMYLYDAVARLDDGAAPAEKGVIWFAEIASTITGKTIQQGGSRRGALMIMLDDDHPDIEEFIAAKRIDPATGRPVMIEHANMSVCASDAFMAAVKDDLPWDLTWQGRVARTVRARDIWDQICAAAWTTAEPGLVFMQRAQERSNTWYWENIRCVNPCVTGDTLIYTAAGLYPAAELAEVGVPVTVTSPGNDGVSFRRASHVFPTGVKPVYRLQTKEGYTVRLTANHEVLTTEGWREARFLTPGDKIRLLNGEGGFGINGTIEQGRILGWLVGDGYINTRKGQASAVLCFWGESRVLAMQVAEYVDRLVAPTETTRRYPVGVMDVPSRDESRIESVRLMRLLDPELATNKLQVPPSVFRGSREMQVGFLQALFTADGTVNVSGHPHAPTLSVRLASSSTGLLTQVQQLLLNFGIVARIYKRRERRDHMLPNGKGGLSAYTSAVQYELILGKANVVTFAHQIGFLQESKQQKLQAILSLHPEGRRHEYFTATFESLTPDGEEMVYDLTEPQSHLFIGNGILLHNCGEQPLPAGGVCNLGALNLERYVSDDGRLLEEDLARDTAYATRFLDDVIDATPYFSDLHVTMQREGTRRTGLGTMGLADALIKMGVAYGSAASERVIDRIYGAIRDASYRASVDLAAEKGPFSRFDRAKYLDGWFIKQLPQDIQDGIRDHGIRNGVILTQAPTGTTSLLAGVSSGIEPVFDFAMKRVDRLGEHIMYHPLLEEWMEAHPGEERPAYFVGAKDLTPEEHIIVQAKVQEYTDSSISKTANAPHDHTIEDVKRLYTLAYELGCKGVTYYRDGSRDAVLTSVPADAPKATTLAENADDGAEAPGVIPVPAGQGGTRPLMAGPATQAPAPALQPIIPDVSQAPVPQPAASLVAQPGLPGWVMDGRLKRRPGEMGGFTRNVAAPEGKVNITINADEDGPLELFINVGRAGSDVAALAEALGRLISLQLRLPSTMSQEERLRQVANQLRGIGGSRSIGFGKDRVLSLPDAVAQAIYRHLEEHPTPSRSVPAVPATQLALPVADPALPVSAGPATPASAGPASAPASAVGAQAALPLAGNGHAAGQQAPAVARLGTPVLTGNLCPQCGSSGAYVFEEGCKKCHYCGYSEC